jgi:hypothetical protein
LLVSARRSHSSLTRPSTSSRLICKLCATSRLSDKRRIPIWTNRSECSVLRFAMKYGDRCDWIQMWTRRGRVGESS